mgnify:FL=1
MKYGNLFVSSEFPERLSNKETLVLFDRMKQGDMEAREELISGNIDLVIRCIRKNYMNTKYDKEELISVGCLGLIKAVDTYDIAKCNYYFSALAGSYICREIEYFISDLDKDSNIISFDEVVNGRRVKDSLIMDMSIDEEYEMNDYNNYMIRRGMECLSERNREILMLYFGFYNNRKYTCEEIGKIMNMSKTGISITIRRSLSILNDRLRKLPKLEEMTCNTLKRSKNN